MKGVAPSRAPKFSTLKGINPIRPPKYEEWHSKLIKQLNAQNGCTTAADFLQDLLTQCREPASGTNDFACRIFIDAIYRRLPAPADDTGGVPVTKFFAELTPQTCIWRGMGKDNSTGRNDAGQLSKDDRKRFGRNVVIRKLKGFDLFGDSYRTAPKIVADPSLYTLRVRPMSETPLPSKTQQEESKTSAGIRTTIPKKRKEKQLDTLILPRALGSIIESVIEKPDILEEDDWFKNFKPSLDTCPPALEAPPSAQLLTPPSTIFQPNS